MSSDPISLAGYCLVASPHLDDANFYRTVILVIAHSEEGCMGLVLNRPTEHSLNTVFASTKTKEPVQDGILFRGGPVQGPLMALHSVSVYSDCECLPGLFFTSNGSHLSRLATLSDISLRVFNGYSGWDANQLEDELKQGGWLIHKSEPECIMGPSENLWSNCVRSIGDTILSSSVKNLKVPKDPQSN